MAKKLLITFPSYWDGETMAQIAKDIDMRFINNYPIYLYGEDVKCEIAEIDDVKIITGVDKNNNE